MNEELESLTEHSVCFGALGMPRGQQNYPLNNR